MNDWLHRSGCGVLLFVLIGGCEFAVDNDTRVERAEQAAARKDYRVAAIELKNVLQSDPAHVAARVMLGRMSLQLGDAVSAAKELERAIELGATGDNVSVLLARALISSGRVDDALAVSVAEIMNPLDRADLNAVHGNAWLQKSETARAEVSFKAALVDSPDLVDALVGMARVHVERGNTAAAERALRRVISRHSGAHAAYAVLGRLQMSDAEYDKAEESYRKAIEYSDDPAIALQRMSYLAGLVDVLLVQRRAGEAQDVAAKMVELFPQHPYALFQGARADFESGDMDGAIEKSQSVISVYSQYQPARLLLAAAAMSKENFSLAEMHLRSLVTANPENVEARRLLAQAQMNLGSPDQAFEALEPLLQRGAADPRLLAMAGSAGLRSGRTEIGLEYLSRGADAATDDAAVQVQAALSFIEAGETERALKLLQEMPESMHGDQRNNLLMLAFLRAGDEAGAQALADRIVAERPDDAGTFRILGRYRLAVNERPEAKAAYARALELDPDDADSAISLARIDAADGDMASASRRFEEIISRDAKNVAAYVGLAELAERSGDQERALALLETALQENPRAVEPALLLSRYYLKTGRRDIALTRAEQAVQNEPNNGAALNMLGLVQLKMDRSSEALGTLERALQQRPSDIAVNYNLAQVQLKLGMDDHARRSLGRVLETNPGHRPARVAMIRFESLAGNHAAALEILGGLIDESPENPDLLILQGDIHVMRAHYKDAIEAYDAAGLIRPDEQIIIKRHQARAVAGWADADSVLSAWLQDNPDSAAVRVALAQYYQTAGRSDDALGEYRQALQTAPDNVVALNNLAWLYAEKGGPDNLQAGLEVARRAHKKMPEVGQVTDTYGWLLLLQGNVDEATAKLRQAVRQAPEDPDIRYHLAVALQRQGSAAEARDLLDAILEQRSGFDSRDDARSLRDRL